MTRSRAFHWAWLAVLAVTIAAGIWQLTRT